VREREREEGIEKGVTVKVRKKARPTQQKMFQNITSFEVPRKVKQVGHLKKNLFEGGR
jgi:hypothetical protein